MAINLSCRNGKCKYNWEYMCTQSVDEKPMWLDESGKCETFEPGTSEWYEESEKAFGEVDIG